MVARRQVDADAVPCWRLLLVAGFARSGHRHRRRLLGRATATSAASESPLRRPVPRRCHTATSPRRRASSHPCRPAHCVSHTPCARNAAHQQLRPEDRFMSMPTNGGPAGHRTAAEAAAAQCAGAIHQGFLVREPERAALAEPTQQQPAINIQINVNAKPLAENDIEVELKLEGKAEAAGNVLFQFELDLRRRVPHPERAAGQHAPADDDRMPAPAVPVRARDRRHRGAQRRLPAAAASIRWISSASIARAWRRCSAQAAGSNAA